MSSGLGALAAPDPAPTPATSIRASGSDRRISYWLKNQTSQNYGDFLSELFVAAFTAGADEPEAGTPVAPYEVIHLIGSVINWHHISNALSHTSFGPGVPLAYWGCGMRDRGTIDPQILARCAFHGVRGPLTRAGLGQPEETVIGDPGLLLPLLHTPRPHILAGRALCIPHFHEPLNDAQLLKKTGADAILRPNLPPDPEACLDMIDAIAGAGFVLAGALHAAITAAAYGVPFAYLQTGFLDVPFKWADFAASAGFPVQFEKTVAKGGRLYETKIRPNLRLPRLEPILRVAPLHVPRDILERASAQDAARR